MRLINGISVPSDFPTFVPTININPDEGKLFVSCYELGYLLILNSNGSPYFYKKSASRCWDFTIQPNGTMSYTIGRTSTTLDNNFEKIQSYKSIDYVTDHHEFRLLPNGNALLIAEDTQPIDMNKLIDDGNPKANVIGNHIQEVDTSGNAVFEWQCWDHYSILDAIHQNLRASSINAVHMNAIDVDFDGNILVSSRHLDEITKINHSTGLIIWRLGGKNNQFTFLNDTLGFNYQHDIRAVPGKPNHYTLLDNGNYHSPRFSRAVEYKLDTQAMTAEKVWEYRPSPDVYTQWMGNVQRLENGNTIVGWAASNLPKVTEISPDGTILYQGDFSANLTSYRVHRFQCDAKAIRPYLIIEKYPNTITLLFNHFGVSNIEKYYIYADTTENPTTRIDSTTNPYIHIAELRYIAQ